MVAPQGPEILGAERDLDVAEAEYRGQPKAVATAQVAHAKKLLELTRILFSVGKATTADVNERMQVLTQWEEALAKLSAPSAPPR